MFAARTIQAMGVLRVAGRVSTPVSSVFYVHRPLASAKTFRLPNILPELTTVVQGLPNLVRQV